jgi:hypothetical protein
MDQESIAFFEERFREIVQQISSLREEMKRRLDKQAETARHTLILVEGLRDNLQLVGEVVMGLGEQLNRYRDESTLSFEKVHGWIEPYFRNLDLKHDGLDRRVRILEDRADRQQGDAMDAIRKMVEKLRREAQPASE